MTAEQTQPVDQLSPVPVHITGMEEGLHLGGPQHRERSLGMVPNTVVLTSDEPAKQLLRPDDNRDHFYIMAATNDVVLSRSLGDAQSSLNITGSLTTPNGALIPHGIWVGPLRSHTELWVSGPTYPTRVSVIAVYKR